MRVLLVTTLAFLSACSWFGSRKHAVPPPTEIVVTGAPADSTVFVDGSPAAAPTETNGQPQVLRVTVGSHVVEIHAGDKVVYREELDVSRGERRVVMVLSGSSR